MGTNKQKYRDLCAIDLSIPIFSQAWWLDAAVGGQNWDVEIVESDGHIVGSWPYVLKQKYGFSIISQPTLTQKVGPRLHLPEGQKEASENRRLSIEKDIFTQLVNQLPKYQVLTQTFNEAIKSWLPFYWKGFHQTTRYSYVLENIIDADEVFTRFSKSKKKDVRKARKQVECFQDIGIDEFYDHHQFTLKAAGQDISYSKKLLTDLYHAGVKHNAAKTFFAKDEQGNIHATFFIVWDQQDAYFLVSSIDPKFRNSGATSLLVLEALIYLSSLTRNFDFEGSMIEPVEFSFRQFGAAQRQLFHLTHIPNRLIQAAMTWKGLV